MPPHPLDACCGSLISQSIFNINRLAANGLTECIRVETEHIAPVVEMLEEYLLRKDHRQLKDAAHKYWESSRPKYLQTADRQAIDDFDTAWYFFAFILSIPYSKEVTPHSGERS